LLVPAEREATAAQQAVIDSLIAHDWSRVPAALAQ